MAEKAEIDIEQISGKKTVSREDGRIVYEKIKRLWNRSDRITINFANLLIASVSFMDEAFGKLASEYSQEELKRKLAFENINQYDRALLNDIISSRIRQRLLEELRKARGKKRTRLAVRLTRKHR